MQLLTSQRELLSTSLWRQVSREKAPRNAVRSNRQLEEEDVCEEAVKETCHPKLHMPVGTLLENSFNFPPQELGYKGVRSKLSGLSWFRFEAKVEFLPVSPQGPHICAPFPQASSESSPRSSLRWAQRGGSQLGIEAWGKGQLTPFSLANHQTALHFQEN